VLPVAVDVDHGFDGPTFSLHPWVGVLHYRSLARSLVSSLVNVIAMELSYRLSGISGMMVVMNPARQGRAE
jgi:hypothetical protein